MAPGESEGGAIRRVVMTVGFSWYATNFGSHDKTYGTLGAVIGFVTGIILSTTVLQRAQHDAEMEAQTARDAARAAPTLLDRCDALPVDTVA